MRSLPPVATAALAFATGVAVSRIGALVTVAPLVVAGFLFAPIGVPRPWIRFVLAAAGLISGLASDTVY